MARRATQLSGAVLSLLSILLVMSFITGIGLWFVHEQREKLLEPPGWTKLCQVAHGVVNPLICVLYGWLWYSHIVGGWKMKVNRKSGGALAGTVGGLILTGAAIYYSNNRHLYFSVHLFLGLILPVIIFFHVLAARRWLKIRPEKN